VFSGFGFADGIDTMGGQVMVQLIGIGSTFIYTAVVTWVILKLVAVMTGGLRVSEEIEIQGLDTAEHEETGYNL
jgi:Amt family ammonium transporter